MKFKTLVFLFFQRILGNILYDYANGHSEKVLLKLDLIKYDEI